MFLFLVILLTIFVVAFANFNQMGLELHLMYTDIKFKMSFLSVTVLTYCLGIVGGILLMLRAVFKSAELHGKTKRRLEKTSVGADDSELRVKTLENKIATLESALQKAIGDKKDE
ncbi:hypothetical protein tpqmel_0528 [Candidatus Gastranaerophilus sp. (ex Termes propinquus)]|nr:hypothetical protein tpqmel_0528 [Candidatus Gastranaerophilus sp. (ex Termes propinquus)]